MQTQCAPVIVQPPAQRPFMHGTRIAGINFPGALIVIIIVGSSLVVIAGFFMTLLGIDEYYSYNYYRNYYRTSDVRKAGIALLVLGLLSLIFGIVLAFKGHNENKLTRGIIIQQIPAPGFNQPVQQAFTPGYGYAQNVPVFGYSQNVPSLPQPQQLPQAQQSSENNSNWQESATVELKS